MLSYYSSYMEFLGAVYFTMSLDDILKRKVWSPQDEYRLNKAVDGFDVSNNESLKQAIIKANRTKGDILQAELSKKSVMGMFFIACLLVLCGYEQQLANDCCLIIDLHLSVIYTSFILLLYLFLGGKALSFRKWKYTSLTIISTVLLFLVIFYKKLVYGQTNVEAVFVENFGLTICCLLTIPILWQLIISWLYKSVFYSYIKNRIQQVNNEYKNVTSQIQQGDHTNIPNDYLDIFMRLSMLHKDGTTREVVDDSLTEYQGVLFNRIKKLGEDVKLYNLFISWVCHCLTNMINRLHKKQATDTKISFLGDNLGGHDFESHALRFQSMQAKKKITLRGYCELTGIETVQFIKYLKGKKAKKS